MVQNRLTTFCDRRSRGRKAFIERRRQRSSFLARYLGVAEGWGWPRLDLSIEPLSITLKLFRKLGPTARAPGPPRVAEGARARDWRLLALLRSMKR